MKMEERIAEARRIWEARDVLWRLGISTATLAAAFGYKDRKTLAIKLVHIRKRYPDLFAARGRGFVPVESRLRKLSPALRECAGMLDSLVPCN
jgi:hypothetical protein